MCTGYDNKKLETIIGYKVTHIKDIINKLSQIMVIIIV